MLIVLVASLISGCFAQSQLTWNVITPTNTANVPSGRFRPGLAYDNDNSLLLMFGGKSDALLMADTWMFDFTANNWVSISTANAPEPRFSQLAGIKE